MNFIKIVLAIVFLLAGFGLFFGRQQLIKNGKPPNLVIPAVLLIVAAVITLTGLKFG